MPTPARPPFALPELVMAWGRGRAVSRLTAPPVPFPGGFSVEVGAPGRRTRHVLHTCTPAALERTVAALTAPGNEIMTTGPIGMLLDAVTPEWTIDPTYHLMAVTFEAVGAKAPVGYRVEVTTDGDLNVAVARDERGETAASARLGRTGEFGVFDKVQTEPAHQRRGLGTAVMGALTDRAVEAGMNTGVLVASDEGRVLYEALGWSFASAVAGAFVKPETDTAE